ncbi:ATP synthase subunit I [uncultured Paraglaciecola sp.]|uniref:N-ATPase subunit AtpR n=1 Tax=uncultured Paraglaciecola sp. TaxID=1765024 RepID=UPI0025CC5DC7|nr:ATP synthase subunit I [uncultured Paraglaciecola sp.]
MINALTEMLSSPLELSISLMFGFTLGCVFFLSLWWVVYRGLTSKRPALWFVGGFFIRMGICIFGFYLIADGNWQSLVSSLLGFILARPITKLLLDLIRKDDATKASIKDAA